MPSRFPAGLEERVDEGKLRNEETRIPRRRPRRHTSLSSHLSSPRAMPTAPTVRGAAAPAGVAPLAPEPQDRHGHGVGQEPRQEQRRGQLPSPRAAPGSLSHPQNPLSFHPWALAIRFTKSGGQKDGTSSLSSLLWGWWRWKEIPVLSDAPPGRGDEPWSRAFAPQDPPSSPPASRPPQHHPQRLRGSAPAGSSLGCKVTQQPLLRPQGTGHLSSPARLQLTLRTFLSF